MARRAGQLVWSGAKQPCSCCLRMPGVPPPGATAGRGQGGQAAPRKSPGRGGAGRGWQRPGPGSPGGLPRSGERPWEEFSAGMQTGGGREEGLLLLGRRRRAWGAEEGGTWKDSPLQGLPLFPRPCGCTPEPHTCVWWRCGASRREGRGPRTAELPFPAAASHRAPPPSTCTCPCPELQVPLEDTK